MYWINNTVVCCCHPYSLQINRREKLIVCYSDFHHNIINSQNICMQMVKPSLYSKSWHTDKSFVWCLLCCILDQLIWWKALIPMAWSSSGLVSISVAVHLDLVDPIKLKRNSDKLTCPKSIWKSKYSSIYQATHCDPTGDCMFVDWGETLTMKWQ